MTYPSERAELSQQKALNGGKGVADFLHGMTEYDITSYGMSHVQVVDAGINDASF